MANSFDNIQSDSVDFDARDAYEAQQELCECGEPLIEWCDEYGEGAFCPECEGQDDYEYNQDLLTYTITH